MLAVCGGGGSDVLAFVVIAAIGSLYLIAVGVALLRAVDGLELAVLAALLLASIGIGGFAFLYPNGLDGDGGGYLARFILSLVASGALGLVVAARWREESVGRMIFVALAGNALIPGGILVFLFASLILGTGCLD